MDNSEYFECCCHSPEHLMRFNLDREEPSVIYISVHLSSDVWHKRIVNAVRYVFGHTSRYGHFDEFLFRQEDCDKLISMLEEYKKCKNTFSS